MLYLTKLDWKHLESKHNALNRVENNMMINLKNKKKT